MKATPNCNQLKTTRNIIICTWLILCSQAKSLAQDSLPNSFTDVSKVGIEKRIGKTVSTAYVNDTVFNYASLRFTPGIANGGSVSNEHVTDNALLQFNLCNTADTAISVYFCPGFYFNLIRLYQIEANQPVPLQTILPDIPNAIGYRKITVAGKDSITVMAMLGFVRTYNNAIRPRLIQEQFLPSFISNLHRSYYEIDLLTFVFCGLMLMMVFFSMANFMQGANPDFLYYSFYAFFLGGMLFTQTYLHFRTSEFSYFFEGYLDFICQGTGIIFYILFMQRFLNTKEHHPFLYRFYNAGIGMLIGSMLLFTFFHYFTDNYSVENLVENATKIVLLLMILIFLVYALRHRADKLLRFLFWGNLFLFIFALISQLAIIWNPMFKKMPGVFGSSVFYYEVGLLLELIFFLAGLNHKNRRQIIAQTKERETLKAQNLLKEYEKEIAVYKAQQEERQRISADMHDELGSGMTAIRLMSEIARNKMKENTPVEIDKISASADDVLNKMNAIIWSMNSGNDSLDNLISYIRSYAIEYFDNTPVSCRVHTPVMIPEKELTGDKRRNVFLSVKETLNNVLKHAKASEVSITIEADHRLSIVIADNGTGIDMENLRQFGNGLKNMARRMESIGGSFTIRNNNGTVTTLVLPL